MLTLFSAIRDSRRRRRHHDGTTFTSVGAGSGASSSSSTAYDNQAANMKPQVRDELTHDILTNAVCADNAQEMEEIETCLEQALDMLRAAQEREEFVGMRLKRYQTILRERARELEESESIPPGPEDHDDEEEEDGADASVNTPLCHVTNRENENIDNEHDDDRDVEQVHNKDSVHGTDVSPQDDDEEVGAPALSPEERQRRVEKLKRDMAALQKVESDYETMKEHTFTLKKRIFKLERQRDIILQKTAECQEFLLAAAAVEGREEAGLEMVTVAPGDEHDTVVAASMPQGDANSGTASSVVTETLADMTLENGIDNVDSDDDDDDNSDFDDHYNYTYNERLTHDDNKDGTGEAVIDKSSE